MPGSALHRFGEVHLSFVTSYDPSHSFLAPFALHRQVLGVLGLGSFSSSEDRANLEKAPSALRELHPNAIVHRAFIFDSQAGKDAESEPDREVQAGQGHTSEDEKQSDESSDVPASPATQPAEPAAGFSQVGNTGLVIFPAVRRDGKDVRFYLRTLLREFVGILLDGLWDIVKTLEGGPLETPRETLDGSLIPSSASSTQSSATTTGQSSSLSPTGSAASRASSFFSSFGASSSSSGTSGSSSPAAIGGGTQPAGVGVGASSGESKTPLSMSSASRSSKAKRTSSLVGAGPTGAGRYAKIRADYSLLSGDLWGAIGGYDTCMSWLGKERALAGGQDAVWYASALEGWAVTRSLIFRMSGLEEKVSPSRLCRASEKTHELLTWAWCYCGRDQVCLFLLEEVKRRTKKTRAHLIRRSPNMNGQTLLRPTLQLFKSTPRRWRHRDISLNRFAQSQMKRPEITRILLSMPPLASLMPAFS